MKKQRKSLTEWQGKGLVLAALALWGGFWIPFVFTSSGVEQMEQHMNMFCTATAIVLGVGFFVGIVLLVRDRKHLSNPFRRDYWK